MTWECKCCRNKAHHCKRCWDEHHNGKKHNDYEPPTHYGQWLLSDETREEMIKMGIEPTTNIKEDKNREYKEGEYH